MQNKQQNIKCTSQEPFRSLSETVGTNHNSKDYHICVIWLTMSYLQSQNLIYIVQSNLKPKALVQFIYFNIKFTENMKCLRLKNVKLIFRAINV